MSDKEILLFLFLGTIFVMLIVLIFLILKKRNNHDYDSSKMIQEHLFNISKNFDEKIMQTNYLLDKKLSESNRYIQDNISKTFETSFNISKNSTEAIEKITKKITNIEETNKQIKDIWWQLEWLESILKNPKNRWILGEYFLESVLKNILPPENYSLQYKFKSWEIVDAVIFLDDKIIAIDSKFSLDNYNKILNSTNDVERKMFEKLFRNDLKKRIDETAKYIKPSEKTMEFSFMFISSEWIYYDLLVNKVWSLEVNTIDLVEYAFKEKKVIIVSPTSFYAYLQTVMQWLRALKIENHAQEIKKQIQNLSRHLWAYEQYFIKLGNTLNTTVNHYNNAKNEFKKIDKDVFNITGDKVKKIK